MARDGGSTRLGRRLVVAAVVLAAGCGGDDDDDAAATSPETTTPATTSTEAGAAATTPAAAALEQALLTTDDFGEGWTTEGPAPIDFGDAAPAEIGGRCPNGSPISLPVDAVEVVFDAGAETAVSVAVLTFAAPEDLDAWPQAFDSCVGEQWEESDDPVEHVTIERLDIDALGDEAAWFRTVFAHSDLQPAHDSGQAFVPVGDVLVAVSVDHEELTEPYDSSLLEQATAKAVAKAAAVLG